jgi:hypothetical protein
MQDTMATRPKKTIVKRIDSISVGVFETTA